jgi:DNA-binding MarR family transcriptional regulator
MYMNCLSIISRYSRTFFERRLAELSIGFTEHSILVYLDKCDVLNQEQIAKHFMLDKGAVAKALNKLEEKNYITRQENPSNKRNLLK